MKTVGELYQDLRKGLKYGKIPRPDFEAKQILGAVLDKDAAEVLRDTGLYVTESIHARLLDMERARVSGHPLAYVLGHWDFYGLTFIVTPDTLIPRADTEILAETALEWLNPLQEPSVLDLCCGCGCIGLALAHARPDAGVTMADVSHAALEVAGRNAAMIAPRVKLMEANALAPPDETTGPFDLIVSNPPYISGTEFDALEPAVRDYEPELALRGGADGLDFYRALAGMWAALLKPGGAMIAEVGYKQAEAVTEIFRGAGLLNVRKSKDYSGIWRVVTGQKGTAKNSEPKENR